MKLEDFKKAHAIRTSISEVHNKSIKVARFKNRDKDDEFMEMKDLCLELFENYKQRLENEFDAL